MVSILEPSTLPVPLPHLQYTNSEQADLINYRVKVICLDGREIVGEFLAFDKHFNMVLANSEEFRLTKKSLLSLKERSQSSVLQAEQPSEASLITEQKRSLGLIILRGENVISVTIDAPPSAASQKRLNVKPGSGTVKVLNKAAAPAAHLSNPVKTGNVPGIKSFNPPPGFRRS